MSDLKISQLPAVTSISGSDLLAVVKGGVTSKITFDDLQDNITKIAIGDEVTGAVIDKLLYVDALGELQQITLGANISLTGDVLNVDTMGGEDLAATLAIGNITGGNNIILTSGDLIYDETLASSLALGANDITIVTNSGKLYTAAGSGAITLSDRSIAMDDDFMYLFHEQKLRLSSLVYEWTNDDGAEMDAVLYIDGTQGFFGSSLGSFGYDANSASIQGGGAELVFTTTGAVASTVRGIQFTNGLAYFYHGTELSFDSPIYNFAQLSASTVPYLNASKNLVSSGVTPTQLSYVDATSSIQTQLNARELLANKATDFSTVNNTLYPTVQAVQNYVTSAVAGLLDYRGGYDASTNLFPATGGSGLLGAILKGDFWFCTVTGTLGGTVVKVGDMIIANTDTPGQTAGNWDLISKDLGYVAADVAGTLAQFAATTSAQLASVISDETGSGALVFATSPTLVTPILGVASATSLAISGTAGAGFLELKNQSSTPGTPGTALRLYSDNSNRFNIMDVNGYSLTFDATALSTSRSKTLQNTSSTIAEYGNKLSVFAATTSAELAGVISDETGTGALVFATSPTLTTPTLSSNLPTVAGSIGYDGVALYSTTSTGATGVNVSTMYSIVSASTFTLSTATGVQSCFESTGDVWTLNASTTYLVEGYYAINKSGTACTIAIAFALAGGASITSMDLAVFAGNISAVNTISGGGALQTEVTQIASTVVTASTSTTMFIRFSGLIRMNGGGTVTPQINFSASPTSPVMRANSYIMFTPMGTNVQNVQGNTE